MSLKNTSIEVIRGAFPDAIVGAPAYDTHKGTVAHLRPTADSVARVDEPAQPRWIIFPRWREGAEARLTAHSRADAFLHTASHAFNYSLLGSLGFELNAALDRRLRLSRFRVLAPRRCDTAFAELAA